MSRSIYLAGPMTGIPHHNVPAFDAAAGDLRAAGWSVVSPPDVTRENPHPGIRSDGSIDPNAYAALVRLDLLGLLDCEAVVLLPGWSRSIGARLEIAVARAIGLPIYLLSEFRGADIETARIEAVRVTVLGLAADEDGAQREASQAGSVPND